MELSVLLALRNVLQPSVWEPLFAAITSVGDGGFIWFVIAGVACLRPQWRLWGIGVAVAVILAWVFGEMTIKPLVARPRPFMADPSISLVIPPPSGFSFPSGHSASSVAAVVVIWHFVSSWRVKVGSALLAGCIAFSRMYLLVHYPSDVAAGVLLGIAVGFAVVVVMKRSVMPRWTLTEESISSQTGPYNQSQHISDDHAQE